jgi:CheY-like chemotaxis protein
MKQALVVDDEFTVREAIARLLTMHGYSVRKANDGVEAFESLSKQRCDVVICDHRMPRCDGPELVARMRAVPALAAIPVVMVLDPYGPPPELVGVISLVKPVRVAALLSAVRQALDVGIA